MPINDAGVTELTRQVVSVEFIGELKVEVEALYAGEVIKNLFFLTLICPPQVMRDVECCSVHWVSPLVGPSSKSHTAIRLLISST